MYQDKVLVCKDCGKEFVWTAGEQQFYAEKGFQNEPVRCKACREAKKEETISTMLEETRKLLA
ncbi:zinc-ribbon domain-containing protein [Thermoanaerobacter sp. RKWS2]|nr:zinc-ribbon domain-containing protein [Thermoanaerobacter sp. RKWS2]